MLVIACEDCVMQHTSNCEDCLVTFVCSGDPADDVPEPTGTLVFDPAEALAVRRLTRAGLVPALRHSAGAVRAG